MTTTPTGRHTASSITDPDLQQLYDERDQARAAVRYLIRDTQQSTETEDEHTDRVTPDHVQQLVSALIDAIPVDPAEERDLVWSHYRRTHRVLSRRLQRTEAERDRYAAAQPALEGLQRLIATSSRDWGEHRVDAWLWAVLVGWDCEETHEHDELCDNGAAMREMAARHGWDDETVAKARRYRAAVKALVDGQPELATAAQQCTEFIPDTPRATGLCTRCGDGSRWHQTATRAAEGSDL